MYALNEVKTFQTEMFVRISQEKYTVNNLMSLTMLEAESVSDSCFHTIFRSLLCLLFSIARPAVRGSSISEQRGHEYRQYKVHNK